MPPKPGTICRREFLRSVALVSGGLALVACTPAQPTPEPTKAPAAEATAATATGPTAPPPTTGPERVSIEWWNPMGSPANKAVLPAVVDDFMKAYPYVTVKYELSFNAPGGGDYVEALMARVAAGDPPDCTTIWTPAAQYAAKGSLLAIDEYMASAKYAGPDKWLPMVLRSCQFEGQTYGLPTSAANSAIFINADLFKAKGISTKREDMPKTWDELKALSAEFVQWEGDLLKTAGFMPWLPGSAWSRPAWSVMNGGVLFDVGAGQYRLDSEQNVEMLEYWVKWLDEQFRGDVEKLQQSGAWGGVHPNEEFWKGTHALAEGGAWVTTNAGEPIPFEWEVFRAPVGPHGTKSATAWYPNWQVIFKGSKHPYEGFLFNEYFCTLGWLRWYREGCAEVPAWTDADITGNYNIKEAEWLGVDRAKEVEAFFRDYLKEDGVDMWDSPVEDYANDIINSAIDEVLHKVKPAKQALSEAQELCQDKLDELLNGA